MTQDNKPLKRPRIAITYCTQCHWLLRAAWMAQELLSTFGMDLGEVALIPATGGAFSIVVDDETVWERKRDGGFPDVKALNSVSETGWILNAISATSTGSIARLTIQRRDDLRCGVFLAKMERKFY